MSITPETKQDRYGAVPKTMEELPNDPLVRHFDMKTIKAKEIMIFMEENKIWQDLLADCIERSGVNAGAACKELQKITDERVKYYNSRFNAALRPNTTPGIPPEFERHGAKTD